MREIPSWWTSFKQNWNKAAKQDPTAKNISDPTFALLFINTKHRHDYPLIYFDNKPSSRINSINSSWDMNINNSIEFLPEFNNSNEIFSNNAERNSSELENLEKTNEAADEYIKSMETAIQLLKQNKNNQQFIEAFGKVGGSLIKEIDTCQEVLNQRTQQYLVALYSRIKNISIKPR
ncbi:29518_t:CDS:2, partial [Racocetra persica]